MGAEGVSEAQKRVMAIRKEYLQKVNNPYRHMTAEGGHVVSLCDFQAND